MADSETAFEITHTLAEINAKIETCGWRHVSRCPACQSTSVASFAEIRHITYARCRGCGFTFANPIPTDEALGAFYNSPFYNNYRVMEQGRIETEPYFSISYQDLPRLAKWVDLDREAKILDFGCGPASFVAMLRDRGYAHVEGLELNARSVEVAKRCYGIELAPSVEGLQHTSYDLVILIEVIEHFPDPEGVLRIIRGLLKPGGRLFVTTDSVRNFTSRYLPNFSAHYTGPSHISLFTEEAMRRLMNRLGFSIMRTEADDASEILGRSVAAPLYNLDILSPQSAHDTEGDIVLTPNGLGRALRLKRRIHAPRPLSTLGRADRFLARLLKRLSMDLGTEHMYVMAQKQD